MKTFTIRTSTFFLAAAMLIGARNTEAATIYVNAKASGSALQDGTSWKTAFGESAGCPGQGGGTTEPDEIWVAREPTCRRRSTRQNGIVGGASGLQTSHLKDLRSSRSVSAIYGGFSGEEKSRSTTDPSAHIERF